MSKKCVVLKFGGNAMVDSTLLQQFAEDVTLMRNTGVDVIVVHGGGPQISSALASNGIATEFVDGLRVTPANALPVIRDVLLEDITRPLVSLISQAGSKAIALNGLTEDLFLAEVTRPDLGWVGEVFAVRDGYLSELLAQDVVPVISSIAADESGNLVNVNADLAAASVAIALRAEELVMLTDVDGIYANFPDKNSLIKNITFSELAELAPNLDQGMIPKVEAALSAIGAGVKVVRIVNGSLSHALLKLDKEPEGFGTKVEG
ncbi:MAG: acetylglutamate kinase [Rhodoluna sp.]